MENGVALSCCPPKPRRDRRDEELEIEPKTICLTETNVVPNVHQCTDGWIQAWSHCAQQGIHHETSQTQCRTSDGPTQRMASQSGILGEESPC